MKVNKLLKNKVYKKLVEVKLDIIEFLWDIVHKINDNLIQDFYPFPQCGKKSRFKIWDVIIHPIRFWHYSFTCNRLDHWIRFDLRYKIDKVQEFILGKKLTKILDWFINRNDSKLLDSSGWFAYIRNREQDTNYYSLRILPGGYAKLSVSRFIEEGSENGTNMYMRSLKVMLSDDYKEPKIKEEKILLYKGFIWRKRDLFKLCRQFCLKYYGTRWHYYCTNEWREIQKKWDAEWEAEQAAEREQEMEGVK